jgi:hypothetical protein
MDFKYSVDLDYSCNSYTAYLDIPTTTLSVIEVIGVEFSDSAKWVEENTSNERGSTIVTSNNGIKTVRSDGIFVAHSTDKFSSYLRFYDDGIVITNIDSGQLVRVFRWLNRDNFTLGLKYTVEDNTIRFVNTSGGTITYDCKVTEQESQEAITCDIYSTFNQRRFQKTFEFVPLPKTAK